MQNKHESELNEFKARITSMETCLHDKETQIKGLKTKLESTAQYCNELKCSFNEQRDVNTNLKTELEQLKEKNKSLDKRFENASIMSVDTLMKEKSNCLSEIEDLKCEISQLILKHALEREELTKKFDYELKHSQQSFLMKFKKQASEIERLNQLVKVTKESNTLLSDQVNNLNKQIFEYESTTCQDAVGATSSSTSPKRKKSKCNQQ